MLFSLEMPLLISPSRVVDGNVKVVPDSCAPLPAVGTLLTRLVGGRKVGFSSLRVWK